MTGVFDLMRLFPRGIRESAIARADRAVRAGDFERALALYREALARNPDNPPIWLQCGHLQLQRGDPAAAEAAYRRAISIAPHAAEPHLHLGHALKRQDRLEEAETAYLRALALDPSIKGATRELDTLGWTEEPPERLRASGQNGTMLPEPTPRHASANRYRSLALRFWPKRLSAVTLADRARDVGQFARAARFYRKALRRNPRNTPVWVQYGHVLKALGRLDEAETAYRSAAARDPYDPDPHLHFGHILKLRNRTKAAEAAYLRALAVNPALGEPLRELGGLGWSERALAELELIAKPNRA